MKLYVHKNRVLMNITNYLLISSILVVGGCINTYKVSTTYRVPQSQSDDTKKEITSMVQGTASPRTIERLWKDALGFANAELMDPRSK